MIPGAAGIPILDGRTTSHLAGNIICTGIGLPADNIARLAGQLVSRGHEGPRA